ncbi:hypothetical protein HAX54_020954 [Datura stramonium]|uniref:Putative plant transposon protein domain-containing protein n=1 Tax=Datura stramonium TaxID=4076 RepID=A0ABS8UU00_DATST|nr:hypothetical protein [Datura stramonium]
MVHEFYANNIAILEGLYKMGQKPAKMCVQGHISVHGEIVDISEETINRMLDGSDFMPPTSIIEFEYRIREQHNQCRWLAQVLTDGGDNTSTEHRATLIASLTSGFPLNIGEIIIEEIMCRVVKLSVSLPFPCLITRLCREAHVPILARINMETYTTKNGQTARVTKITTDPAGEATRAKLVCHVAPIPTYTRSTSGAAATQLRVESTKISFAMTQSSLYAFTTANFARMVRKENRQEMQLKLFTKKLGLFVDQDITTTLDPYKNRHAHIDDVEARVNDGMKDLTVPDLARFVAELIKAQEDILKLQHEHQPQDFSNLEFEELQDDVPFIDLLGEQPKVAGKHP